MKKGTAGAITYTAASRSWPSRLTRGQREEAGVDLAVTRLDGTLREKRIPIRFKLTAR